MNVEKLIEEVRKFPVLYDQSSEKYRNADYKEKIWKQISAALQIKGVDECKKKWASIRDQFRKTVQKRKTVSGQAAVHNRKYKYEDLLEFLKPHITTKRQTLTNVSVSDEDEINEIDTVSQEDEVAVQQASGNTNVETYVHKPESQIEGESYISENSQASSAAAPSVKSSRQSNLAEKQFSGLSVKRKKTRGTIVEESPSSRLMAYILKEKETEKQEKVNEGIDKHPVDAFLVGIATSLKSLDPFLFHEAKGRIFSIVQELEMKQLIKYQNQYNTHNANHVNVSVFSPVASSSTGSVSTPFPSPLENEMTHQSENNYYNVGTRTEISRQQNSDYTRTYPSGSMTETNNYF